MRPSRLLLSLALLSGCADSPATGPAPAQEPSGGEGEGEPSGITRGRYDDPLTRIGYFPARGAELQDVWLADRVAFACSGNAGLHTFDLHDPAAPVQRYPSVINPDNAGLGGFGRCQHVVAKGRQVYASARRDQLSPDGVLVSIDARDLGNPGLDGRVESELSFEGLDLRGDRLLVAAHGAGVRIFDAPDDGSLTEAGGFVVEDAWGVRSAGDRVAVAAGRAGFELHDVGADGTTRVGGAATGGLVRDVEWLEPGKLLAVAAGPAGVQIWSVEVPDAPQRLGQRVPTGTALDVSAFDGLVAAATFNDVQVYRGAQLGLVATERVFTSDPISRPLAVSGAGGLLAVAEWGGLVLQQLIGDDSGAVSGPEARLERSELDFGRIPTGNAVAQVLVVHNDGDSPLVIDGGRAWTTEPQGAGVFKLEAANERIEPGGALALEVTATTATDEPVRGIARLFTDDADERAFEVELRANDRGLEVGEEAPPLAVVDLEGRTRSLADHAGDVVLLVWFGTYCPVCVPEMSDLETAIWREYGSQGLVMWGLNPGRGDTADDVQVFREQLDLTFPLMFDDVDYWRQFERSDDAISAFPIHVLIGRDGSIHLARRRYERVALVRSLERALAEGR